MRLLSDHIQRFWQRKWEGSVKRIFPNSDLSFTVDTIAFIANEAVDVEVDYVTLPMPKIAS